MTALERLAIAAFTLVAILLGAVFGMKHYGTERYDEGYAAAVAAGKAQHDRDAAAALKTESDLRAKLATRDADAQRKEQEHAQELADAQRRVRAGVDRLRCPASPVQPSAAAPDRPVAAGSAVDGGGPEIVPEDAAEILGDGAAVASLVSRYERVVERFEECRAVNAK
jgi:hypothetical protein